MADLEPAVTELLEMTGLAAALVRSEGSPFANLVASTGPRLSPAGLFDALLDDAPKAATRRARDQGIRDFADFLVRFVGRVGELTLEPALACQWLIGLDRGSANNAVDKYRHDLLERKLSPHTVNQRISTLNRLVWIANKYNLCQWSLVQESLRIERQTDTEGIGRAGWLRFYAQAQREAKASDAGVRNLAITCLLYFCALRREEIATINLGDWNPDSGRLSVQRKHRHQKTYAANPNAETAAALETWLAVRGREPGPLFYRLDRAATGRTAKAMGLGRQRLSGDSLWHLVVAIGGRCKPPLLEVHPHAFRHAALTEAARRGANPRDLQEFGAHSSFDTTEIYIKNSDDGASKVGRLLSES